MLEKYLPSVVAHSSHLATVYIADNASTDDSVDFLRREYPQLPLILLDQNYGFAEGYNRALQETKEEFLLLLNSDIEVSEGWLEPMLVFLDEHPDYAACQPKLRSIFDRSAFEYAGASGGYIDKWGYPYCRGRIFDTVEHDAGQYDDIVDIHWATGAALMVRRDDFFAVGGLDARFFAHQEEIDLCWRLRSRGRGVVCVPQSVAYHLGGGTLPQGNPKKDYLNFRNNLLLLYKNLPAGRLWKVMFLRFWLDALASVRFILRGQYRSFLAVWRARFDFWCLLPQFRKDRKENLRQAKLKSAPEQSSFSLLWQYHVKGRKTWKTLPK